MKNIRFSSVETFSETFPETSQETSQKTFQKTFQETSLLWALCIILGVFSLNAQPPAGYYAAAQNKNGYDLRVAMHNIIKNHTSLSYGELWDAFYTTDKRPDNGKVWDMYSDKPGGTAAYYFTLGSDQCGNYSSEGDCYNREHSVPKSWFGGKVAPMYTDLFHLIPTDGWVNNKRGDLPIGNVTNVSWTSTNGSKVGNSNVPGYSGQVFEPIDSFKGDFARTYFYMAVCYMDKNLGVETQSNFSGGNLKPWTKELLLEWAALDPVSTKEIDRNNAVYQLQNNRNPFIDYPELAEMIFGSDTNVTFQVSVTDYLSTRQWQLYPNPTSDVVNIQPMSFQPQEVSVEVLDLLGKPILTTKSNDSERITLDISPLAKGLYLIKITSEGNIKTYKIVKQ